jgi:hypothetical protein
MAKQMPASENDREKVLHVDDRQLITQWVQEDSFTDDVTFTEYRVVVRLSAPYYHSDVNQFVGAMVRQFPILFDTMGRNDQSIWFKPD